nr:GyrI-like domain-containing protein [Candidatus Solincola tengchongensis]
MWWAEEGEFDLSAKDRLCWRLMIMQPEAVDEGMFVEARERAAARKGNPILSSVSLRRFREGTSIQILHLGPYEREPDTVERLESFAAENGLRLSGKHHEIYLSDPRRTTPERLQTVIRYAVSREEAAEDV